MEYWGTNKNGSFQALYHFHSLTHVHEQLTFHNSQSIHGKKHNILLKYLQIYNATFSWQFTSNFVLAVLKFEHSQNT